jgi:phosphatidylserine decarboxylase
MRSKPSWQPSSRSALRRPPGRRSRLGWLAARPRAWQPSRTAIAGLLLAGTAVTFWRYVYFFRDPNRTTPTGRNIVAPADGKIVYVREFNDGVVPIAIKGRKQIRLLELTRGPVTVRSGHIIGIYMTLWDVHVNRSPTDGLVEQVSYHGTARNRSMAVFGVQALLSGRPSPAVMGHVLENERNTICIRGDTNVCVVQIADFYVNKVQCWVRAGQRIRKGERIGRIVMGSQVDVLIQDREGLQVLVRQGDVVKAGETVIASY